MNSQEVRIAGKVTLLEGKNSVDAVDAHGRRPSRIVDLHAGNVVQLDVEAALRRHMAR